jgi:2TM domain
MPQRSYSREEVQAILASAVERQHGQGDQLSHEELLAIGRELGVSREAIEAAAASGAGDEVEVQREVRITVQRLKRGFLAHLVPFILVNVFLAVLNLMIGGPLWFVWAVLGWGIGLGCHALAALAPDREELARRARRRIERDREKLRRKSERGALTDGARRVAEAVHDRTAEVLHAVADALESAGTEDVSKVRVEPGAAAAGKPRVGVQAEARTQQAHAEAEAEVEEGASRRSAR